MRASAADDEAMARAKAEYEEKMKDPQVRAQVEGMQKMMSSPQVQQQMQDQMKQFQSKEFQDKIEKMKDDPELKEMVKIKGAVLHHKSERRMDADGPNSKLYRP